MSKNSKNRILQLCLSPDLGGLELYVKECFEFLKKNFNIICVLNINSKLEKYFLKQ